MSYIVKKRSPLAKRGQPPIPSQFDPRKLVLAGLSASGKKQQAFETLDEAKAERNHRARRLRKHGFPDLADTLANCRKSRRCQSLACPVCGRVRRVRHTAQLLRFLAAYPLSELTFVTLINPADAVRRNQLASFNPNRFVTKLRRQLQRAGFDAKTSFLLAWVDLEWDAGRERFQPHVHAIVYRLDRAVIALLISRWPRHKRVRSRSRIQSINDLPRVATYLVKSWWPSVARRNNRLDIYPHGKRRPPKPVEIEILRWMNSQRPSDLALMMGVKRYGGVIMNT